MALSGVNSLGFSTQVEPVASAGTTLSAIWLIGQFQGVIRPQMPIGSRRITSPFASVSRVFSRFSASMNPCRWPTPTSACCSRVIVVGAPSSMVMVATISS